MAAACAALPDIDALGWPLHLAPASLFAHRGITHSICFALIAAPFAAAACFRGAEWLGRRVRIAGILAVALLSHAFLDGFTSYSSSIAYLAPFSPQRFRFAWTPLGSPGGGLGGQLLQEAMVVFLPALLATWLARAWQNRLDART